MGKFETGDRVVCRIDCPSGNPSINAGDTGTVCSTADWLNGWIGVCWDSPVDGGHSLHGECDNEYGWAVPEPALDFEPDDEAPPYQFSDEEFEKLYWNS